MGEKVPVLVWSNGFCLRVGTMFQNFLTEIASHGFIVISNGGVTPALSDLDSYKDLISAMDWAGSPAAKKYGDVDGQTIIVGGQSCGGVQAIAASKDPRVKMSAIFNSGSLGKSSEKMELGHPIAYFLGGVKDVGYGLVCLTPVTHKTNNHFLLASTQCIVANERTGQSRLGRCALNNTNANSECRARPYWHLLPEVWR